MLLLSKTVFSFLGVFMSATSFFKVTPPVSSTCPTLTLLSLYGRNLLNGCDLTEEIYSHVAYQGLSLRTFDFRDAVGFDD